MASNHATASKNGSGASSAQTDAQKKKVFVYVWVAMGAVSLLWWSIESWYSLHRFILIGGLSLAAFMIGCIIGFLFSSHSEESDSIGKVRDWVLGGLSTLTIAKAASIKSAIMKFAAGPGDNDFAIALGTAVAYAAMGFFFMYLFRERYLNPELAESRKVRGQIEGTRTVDQVVNILKVKLPLSVLTGGDSVSDITNAANKRAADDLKKKLCAPEVDTFLDHVNAAVDDGANLDWDVVSQTANIQYYRTYYKVDDGERVAQARVAIEWIKRALILVPNHVDMTIKYADMLATAGDYQGAVSILERMLHQPDAPLVVRQLLGYVLLFVRGRAHDAIDYSLKYGELVGGDTDSLFNIACAYAQAYCNPGTEPHMEDQKDNHAKALDFLHQALVREPDYATHVREKWIKKGESFECFANDAGFLALVNSKPVAPATPPK